MEDMRPTLKESTCIIECNDNSDSGSDNNIEFDDVNLFCNKQSLKLISNDSITCTKQRRIVEIKIKADENLKVKTICEK